MGQMRRTRQTYSAARVTAAGLGMYAGLLGIIHGICEMLQGNAATGGVMILAIGPPCQADAVWHACLPAMTVLSSFLWAGVVTVGIGLMVALWALFCVQRKGGGLVLLLLSALMMLAGGGFVAPFAGIMAGIARMGAGGKCSAHGVWGVLSRLWPWPLVGLIVWFPAGWVLGYFFNQAMLDASSVLFILFDILLPVLTALTGLARDRKPDAV